MTNRWARPWSPSQTLLWCRCSRELGTLWWGGRWGWWQLRCPSHKPPKTQAQTKSYQLRCFKHTGTLTRAQILTHLSIVEVTEASDDLLLVQLVRFQLHASHDLHGAIVLQSFITSEHGLCRRTLVQPVNLTRLYRKRQEINIKNVILKNSTDLL